MTSHKIRSYLLKALFVAVVVVVLALLFLPAYIEHSLNKVLDPGPYTVAPADSAFYHTLPFIADMHSDALLWGRDLNERVDRGHVDIPRLIEANVALQMFTIVSKTPKKQNYKTNSSASDNITALMVVQARHPRTWTSLLERGLNMCQQLAAAAKTNPNFRVITSGAELREYISSRQHDRQQTAGLLGVEGLHLLEGDGDGIDQLYAAGVRMVAPVHFFDTELGGSAHGLEKGGLTPFGKTVLQQAERRKMLIDLSHASDQLIDDVLALATRPVVVSHTGVRALCPGQRNLSDAQLEKIAAQGGLVGIALFPQAMCSEEVAATAAAMRHAVDVMGLRHVALGSDFDGAVTTPFDVTGLPLLVPALREEGFSESEMAALLGGNLQEFLLANLPAE